MSANHAKLITTFSAFILAAFILLGMQQTFAANETESARTILIAHPVTPGTPTPTPPSKYSLPFNRNENGVITLGPGEPDHTGKSNEAIDFSPKTYGWTQILAVKPNTFAKFGCRAFLTTDYADNTDEISAIRVIRGESKRLAKVLKTGTCFFQWKCHQLGQSRNCKE